MRRNGVAIEDLIDFTPALRDQARTIVAKYKIGPVYTPPALSQVNGPLATLTLGTASGGTNWPGGSYDPETHTVYAYACNACLTPIGLVPPPKYHVGYELCRGHGRAGGPHANRPG